MNNTLKLYDIVKVKRNIVEPTSGWGPINHNHIGFITQINEEDGYIVVNFPSHNAWNAAMGELEIINEDTLLLELHNNVIDVNMYKLMKADYHRLFKQMIESMTSDENHKIKYFDFIG